MRTSIAQSNESAKQPCNQPQRTSLKLRFHMTDKECTKCCKNNYCYHHQVHSHLAILVVAQSSEQTTHAVLSVAAEASTAAEECTR